MSGLGGIEESVVVDTLVEVKSLNMEYMVAVVATTLLILVAVFAVLFVCGRLQTCVTGDVLEGLFPTFTGEEIKQLESQLGINTRCCHTKTELLLLTPSA